MSLRNLRTYLLCLLLVVGIAISPAKPLKAQNGFVSAVGASSSGLAIGWSAQLDLSARDELVDWQLVVDENRATTYFVIEYENRREVIAESDLSPFGVAYGIEGAEKAAGLRKEIIEYSLKNDGKDDVEVNIRSYSLPKSSIYALGARGLVICLDADTGAIRWKQRVGDPQSPTVGLGASNDHVAVASATSIYCLDSSDGRILWDAACKDGISTSPGVSENYLHVPLRSGRLQTFPIEKYGIGSYSRVAQGSPAARPTFSEKNVIWTTEKGHMNVAPLGRKTVSYRLKADGPILSSAAASKGFLYTGSLDGFVYAIDEKKGIVDWEVSTGQGILSAPAAFGDDVFVISGGDKLFRINTLEGSYPTGWQSPLAGIRQIVGFDSELVYCVSTNGRLLGINRETRSVSKAVVGTDIEMVLPNTITDRIYLGSKTGYIQCVHSADSPLPRLLTSDLASNAGKSLREDKSAMGEPNPFGDGSGTKDDTNPFGDGSGTKDDTNPFADGSGTKDEGNPFGDGSDTKDGPKKDEENPFGDDSNPFGGADEDNPFG